MMHFHPSVKSDLCTPAFIEAVGNPDSVGLIVQAYAESDAQNLVDATMDVDVNSYLPDDLLVKVDVATMAHGLEGRSPFLDHELMEFAASLPADLKLRGRTKKYVLKRAARSLLPAAVVDRPKMGFGVPLDHWFRRDLREMARDLLLGQTAAARGYFNQAFVRRLLDDHASGAVNCHYQLWNLLMLELWHRTFIDGRAAS
jgi:asparagine synthase (glutamine-hydrolysing)